MYNIKILVLTLLTVLTLQGCATAVVTGAATGTAIAYDRRTTGSVIDDQGIEFKAAKAVFNNKEIYDQSHINFTSYNGMVLVTGETPNESLKTQVTELVRQIPKVKRVHNELAIAAPSALPSRSSDAWITSKIKAKLTTDEQADPFLVKVVTERGVVYLLGLVTHPEAERAVDIAKNSGGVQRVVKMFEYID